MASPSNDSGTSRISTGISNDNANHIKPLDFGRFWDVSLRNPFGYLMIFWVYLLFLSFFVNIKLRWIMRHEVSNGYKPPSLPSSTGNFCPCALRSLTIAKESVKNLATCGLIALGLMSEESFPGSWALDKIQFPMTES